jgi:UDP-glucose 6-dehydrogenase
VFSRLSQAVGGSLRGKTIAVLGLTFKPDTDDMREAPSIPLVTGLLDMGAKVRAHDPVGIEQARQELPDIEYCDDPYACAADADALVIVTEWPQFRALDLERLCRIHHRELHTHGDEKRWWKKINWNCVRFARVGDSLERIQIYVPSCLH